jgi:hypothetical protein
LSHSNIDSTSTLSCAATTRHLAARALFQLRYVPRLLVSRLQRLYLNYAARLGALALQAARRRLLRYAAHPGASTRHAACRRLLRLRCTSGCLDTSRGSSRRSLSTSTTPRVRVPRHVAPLVVDYFAYAVRPGASARRAARCRFLRLRRTSECLGTSRGSSSTTPCAVVMAWWEKEGERVTGRAMTTAVAASPWRGGRRRAVVGGDASRSLEPASASIGLAPEIHQFWAFLESHVRE